MAESLSPFTLSSNSENSKVFTHSDFKMPLSFAIIGSITATSLKFINSALQNVRKQGFYLFM